MWIYELYKTFETYNIRNQDNRTKYFFSDQRKIDNRNTWKKYVIVTRVKLSVELDVLVIREHPILYNFNH